MSEVPNTTYSENLNWIDQCPVPEWGTGPDGRAVNIAKDPRLPGLFRSWLDDACHHTATVTVARKDSAGRPFYSVYCPDCGKLLRSHLPTAQVRDLDMRHADDFHDLNSRYTKQRQTAMEAIKVAAAKRAQPGNRATYDDYLRSPEWKRRAAKVMQRAGDLCEGCLTNPATEVHHRTYENSGAEFAFELLALCDVCHNRIHARKVA